MSICFTEFFILSFENCINFFWYLFLDLRGLEVKFKNIKETPITRNNSKK